MKILFLGHLNVGETSRMRMEELRVLGHEVTAMSSQASWARASFLGRQLQQRMGAGPVVREINRRVLEIAAATRPHLLWAEKQEHLQPSTLRRLKGMGIRLLHFTPDPYFTLEWKRTRLMDACMPLFDYLVTSKRYEMEAYERMGTQVIYMPLGYSEHVHRPLSPSTRATCVRFASDVAFIGGWEPRREQMLTSVAQLQPNLKIWGYAWDHLVHGEWTIRRAYRLRLLAGTEPYRIIKNDSLGAAVRGGELYGDEYAWALAGAKINVGFLRKICPDQHTTRTFEIPACASMLLADRTDEHQEFFEESIEAEFFASEEELVDKTGYYLRNDRERERLAAAGYRRCLRSGYSYRERLAHVLAAMQ